METGFKLGPYQVEPNSNSLRLNGESLHLEPRVMGVLNYMAKHPGRVLSRQQIINAVWNGLAVTDDVLSYSIKALRKALHDEPEKPTFIQTVRGKGYRLIAPVELLPLTEKNRFSIIQQIGQGHRSDVYLAFDNVLQRRVALKLLKPELNGRAKATERLKREAQAAAALDHPYVSKIYDVYEYEDYLFIAMEHIEGPTIEELLAAGPLAVDRSLQIAAEVTEVLAGFSEKKIVHRAIRPSSITISAAGHVKVTGFGMAVQLSPSAEVSKPTPFDTWENTLRGPFAYSSPELLRGRDVDWRADQFSLGVTLYEMLTGRNPFLRATPFATIDAIANEGVRPVNMIRSDIGDDVAACLAIMLEKDRSLRYQSPEGLQRRLSTLLRQARPPSPVIADRFMDRFCRWLCRCRRLHLLQLRRPSDISI